MEPPGGWDVDRMTETSAVFVNADRGIEVVITPKYRAQRGIRHGSEPNHFSIEVREDWFGEGVLEGQHLASRAETWKAAREVAQEFMHEFVVERANQSTSEVEATHRSTPDPEAAERLLDVEAAAEALADSAGYSDELLESVVDAQTSGQYLLIAHREDSTVTTVHGDEPSVLDGLSLDAIYAGFPVDKRGIDALVTDVSNITTTIQLDDYVVYRFIFGDTNETDIVLPRGTTVASPTFEIAVENVLEEKW